MTAKLTSLTPNLMVKNVKETADYYEKNLGFTIENAVPSPEDGNEFFWAIIYNGDVRIMLHEHQNMREEYSLFKDKEIGATVSFYFGTDQVDVLHDQLKDGVKVIMNLTDKFYGMREFAIEDCNGYVLTFGQMMIK